MKLEISEILLIFGEVVTSASCDFLASGAAAIGFAETCGLASALCHLSGGGHAMRQVAVVGWLSNILDLFILFMTSSRLAGSEASRPAP